MIAAINSALTATMPRRPRQQRRTPDTALSEAIALPAILPHASSGTRLVRNFEHKPFVERKCSGCHNDPESKEPLKTALPGASLCHNCHKDKEADFKKSVVHSRSARGGAQAAIIRMPRTGRPFSGIRRKIFATHATPRSEKKRSGKEGSPHSANGASAPAVPRPHASENKDVLKSTRAGLCYRCHRKKNLPTR